MRESIDRPVILAASGNEDLGFRRKGWNESLEPGRNMIELPWGSSAGVTLRPEISLRAVALEFVVQRFVRLIIPRRLKQSRLGCRRLSPVTRSPVRIFAKTLTRSRPALLRKATVATNSGLGWVNDPNRRSLYLTCHFRLPVRGFFSQRRNPPRKAFSFLPRSIPPGRRLKRCTLPPPSTT